MNQFIECGYTTVEEAFPRKQALAAQEFLWERLAERGIQKNDRSTWQEPMVRMNENYNDPVFDQCTTERLIAATEDLLGQGRRLLQTKGWGWWPVNFASGADKLWDVPTTGWHWDGSHFRHYVDAPDQGLLMLCIFSDIGHHGGGTLVAEGSHKLVARFLKDHPGLELREAYNLCNLTNPWLAELTGKGDQPHVQNRVEYFMENTYQDDVTSLRVVETTGAPGDVILCHPFLYHAASQNHSGIPRFMCNRTTPLKDRMNFDRSDSDYSAVEVSIRNAILV
ncbi:MAG TPA: phytanoyl-CoA dioxygenase family protein [Ktedonobacteraceae bacterium]